MERKDIYQFYQGTDYSKEIRIGNPYRPSEWHMPLYLEQILKLDQELKKRLKSLLVDGRIELHLTKGDCQVLRSTLLHESLFSFYKAFYNYLAARRLYRGGVEHWIEITSYYTKLYLARAINTLLGKQSYAISSQQPYFDPEILALVHPKGYQKYLAGSPRVSYAVDVSIDIVKSEGMLSFSNKGISTHQDTWTTYKSLSVENIDLQRLDNFDTVTWDLIDQRNRENYSFDGYKQLDFNLPPETFTRYFHRDEIVATAEIIYDEMTGQDIFSFQELYHLYKELNLADLPIELEKFEIIIRYMLDDSKERDKLLDLCKMGFPLQNDFLHELTAHYGR